MEAYRNQAEQVVGRRIAGVHAPDAWYLKGVDVATLRRALRGRVIDAVRRMGKRLVVDLDDGTRLGLRFGMTGRLLIDGVASIDRLLYSSGRNDPAWDRFGLRFAGGGGLRIRDPRRLGGVELDPDESRLGVDALEVTERSLGVALGTSATALKARLLDQSRIAGIGNLLADEILWRSGFDPARPVSSLGPDELRRLAARIVEVIRDLMARGGSHTGDLRQAAAGDGRCPRDGALLERRRIGGRTTLSCPAHQR